MWYLAVFVPSGQEGAAEAVAASVWPDDPNARLTIPLVDAAGAAWLGTNAAVSDSEIARLQAIALIPNVRWFRYAIGGDRALGMAFGAPGSLGAPWGWAECLGAAGLSYANSPAPMRSENPKP